MRSTAASIAVELGLELFGASRRRPRRRRRVASGGRDLVHGGETLGRQRSRSSSSSAASASATATRSMRATGSSSREDRDDVERADRRHRGGLPRGAGSGRRPGRGRRGPRRRVPGPARGSGRTRPRAAPGPRSSAAPGRRVLEHLDLGLRVGRRRAASAGRAGGSRPRWRARCGRRPAPSDSRIRATVPTSNRTSPPPTSEPRSMSTTPNRRVAGEAVLDEALGSAARRPGGAAAGGARARLPSGKIGQRSAPSPAGLCPSAISSTGRGTRAPGDPDASRACHVRRVGEQRVEHRRRVVERADRREHVGGLAAFRRPAARGTRGAAARPIALLDRASCDVGLLQVRQHPQEDEAVGRGREELGTERRREALQLREPCRVPLRRSSTAPAWKGSTNTPVVPSTPDEEVSGHARHRAVRRRCVARPRS